MTTSKAIVVLPPDEYESLRQKASSVEYLTEHSQELQRRLRSCEERLKELGNEQKAAFVAGFMASGEGYNGEHVGKGSCQEAAEEEYQKWAVVEVVL